jgi:hypothetical protein
LSAIVPKTIYARSAAIFAVIQPCTNGTWPRNHASHTALASSSVSTTCGAMRTKRFCSQDDSLSMRTPRAANPAMLIAAQAMCSVLTYR